MIEYAPPDMNLQRIFRRAYLYLPYGFSRITGTGPFGPDGAEYIRGTIQTDGNPLKSALLKYHVKQFHGASCSVATIVSVVNALRDGGTGDLGPITQMDILEAVRTANWKERMLDNNYKGRRGLPLSVLGDLVKSSLDAYEIEYKAVETVAARKNSDESKKIRDVLWKRLFDFETRGNCLIIAHFDQGAYLPTLNVPHISPVGGFDPNTGNVVILDVDPDEEKPYKIGFDTFYKGLFSYGRRILRSAGFGGGYVYIRLRG